MNPKSSLYFLESCESTQDEALKIFLRENHLLGVVANRQSAGRGRHARPWAATENTNLLMSVAMAFKDVPKPVTFMPLLCGHLMASAIEKEFATPALDLKWPNDIGLFQKSTFHKVAGILVEVKKDVLIVGCGVNLKKNPAFLEALPVENFSLIDELPSFKDMQMALAESFFTSLVAALQFWQKEPIRFRGQFLEYLHNVRFRSLWGRQMKASWGNGVPIGIDDTGALLLKIDEEVRPIHSGELLLTEVSMPDTI